MVQIERNMMRPPRPDGADTVSIADMLSSAWGALRRHFWLVALTVLGCLALAVAVIVTQTPVYTATATIYIDPRESRGFQEAGGILLNSDALVVDSEVEILMSSTMAERVVDRLGAERFAAPEPATPTLTARLKAFLMPAATDDGQSGLLSPEQAARRSAVAAILGDLEVARRGNTYVIEITVQNTDKRLAAEIANTYTDEYLKSSLDVQSQRFAQLNSWSSTALREALASLQQAENKVNQFRLLNHIDSDGQQVAGSELSETNGALVRLRNERFQNDLVLERIRRFLSDESKDSSGPEIEDQGIADIRSKILEAEIEYARVTATGNKNTPQAIVLGRDLEAMRSQLVDQYQQIAAQLDKQIQSSMAEEKRLTDRAEALRQQVSDVSEKEAQLRELQMRADGERAVYQALLTRFNETSDALVYKSNDARILTAAQVPAGPSAPQAGKILALGLAAGLFIGFIGIFIREQLDDGIRQPRDIEAAGLRYLGAVPAIPSAWFRWNRGHGLMRRNLNRPVATGGRRRRELARMSIAVDFPLSEFSETVRSIVFDAASRSRGTDGAQIIAVTSVAPGEGKSTLAANLAAYFAKQGKSVHLIDFDLKNPALSRIFAHRRAHRDLLVDGSADQSSPDRRRPDDFEFSGQTEQAKASDLIEFVNPEAIANYLESSKAHYDVVVLDAGSLSESSDARMCADLADYVLLAVKWNLISVEQLRRALARGLSRPGKSVGAVLTLVPASEKLERPATADHPARRVAVA